MEENQIIETTETTEIVEQAPKETPPISPDKPAKKSNKALLWFLIILAIIAIIAAAIFGYLYFSNQSSSSDNTQSEIVDEEIEEPAVETEITDTYILKDLDEKIAILFLADNAKSFMAPVIPSYDLDLLIEGELSDDVKIAHVINSLKNQFRPLSAQEIKAAADQSGFTGEDYEYFSSNVNGINSDTVAKKYKEVFGEELKKQPRATSCYTYQYNQQYDFYYDDVLGCGGASPITRHYYKNRYTTLGNKAYVYLSAAMHNAETDKLYCDIASYADMDAGRYPKVCQDLPYQQIDNFAINESNYQNFAEYRLVFNKAEDDTYYFEAVEKL